jgi:predicted RNase H-like HicB family nuclease
MSTNSLHIGFVPKFVGDHTQAATLDQLNPNLKEVIEMLLKQSTATKSFPLIR